MQVERLFLRLSSVGAAAQASVPGVYAWGVTVAPTLWTRGASATAKVAAVVALSMLGAGVVAEHRWIGRARVASLWGFVIACAVSWSAAPASLSPFRIDAPRGLAGVMGWALFAFAWAAPPLHPTNVATPGTPLGDIASHDAPFMPPPTPVDGAYIAGAAVLAGSLQAVGWRIGGAERSLLVHFIALAAGLAVIGAATEIALERHAPRSEPSHARRLRRALAALVALGILALAGLLNALLD